MDRKPTLCIDFDGVVHGYTSGWKGVDQIPDAMVPGFFEWCEAAYPLFNLQIYSSRSKEQTGLEAMWNWISRQWIDKTNGHIMVSSLTPGLMGFTGSSKDTGTAGPPTLFEILIAHEKPAAFLTIDDRAWCFDGTWPDPRALLAFKTWQQRDETQHSRDHRRRAEFLVSVAHAINYSSLENGSNTPDFLLAEFLADVLTAFDRVQQKRAEWYGKPIESKDAGTAGTAGTAGLPPAAPDTAALDLLLEMRDVAATIPAMQGKVYDDLGRRVVELLVKTGRI
jgi:hypothetical protein